MKTKITLLISLFLCCYVFNIARAQTLTATILQGDTVFICSGSAVQLDGIPSGGTPPYLHTWAGPNGFTSIATSITLTVTSNITIIYGVSDSVSNMAYDTVEIIVKPLPNVFSVQNTVACQYSYISPITFLGTIPGTTFNWTNSNPAIGIPASGTGSIPGFPANVAGSATITVTPVANNCTGASTSFSLVIGPLPTATIHVDPDTICAGSAAQLSVSASEPNCVYNWYPATGLSSSVGDPVYASPATTTVYTLTLSNAYGCTSTSSTVVHVLTCSNVATGKVFHDDNNDGLMNYGETGAANILVKCMPDGLYTFTNANGFYQINTTANPQTITLPAPPLFNVIAPSFNTASYTAGQQTDSLNDFALYALPNIRDLGVTLTSLAQPSLFNNSWLYVNYANNGTDTIDATIKLIYDTLLGFTSATPTPSTVSADTLTWNLPQLLPHTSDHILVVLDLPDSVLVGTSLHFTSLILPIAGDTLTSNNTDTLDQVVALSYDPNDKTVSPSEPLTNGQVSDAEPLTYTIRFQNTGTAPALNIIVRDTISNLLNFETLEMVASSHPCTLQVTGNRILAWTFSNINLPDSNANEAQSHGFVKYRIRPLTTLSEEDTIKNTAYIYFDFNAPVATNTVSSYLQSVTTSIGAAADPGSVNIYPNPATDAITIEYNLSGNCIFSLYDITGAQRMRVNLNSASGQEKINLSHLKNGFYIITVTDPDGQIIKTGKLLLER